jgi:tetratricopeptide (TPR) repeat protein
VTSAPPPASPPLPRLAPNKAAEETFARGRELLKQGKYAAACAEFEQSQRLDPQLGTQYNLAGCYDQLGKLATALTLYREIVRRDANAARKAKASESARALELRVPRLKLVLPQRPEGLRVIMNGADASGLIGVDTPIDFGRYTVTATAAGYRTWHKTVEIAQDGRVVSVVIDLQRAP